MKSLAVIRGSGALAAFAAVCLAVCAEQTRFNGMKYFGAPGDWISVRMEGYGADELPALYEGSAPRKVIVRHEVPNHSDVRGQWPQGFPFLLGGTLTLRLRSWDGTFERVLGAQKVANWSFGQEKSFRLVFEGLKPGAYLVTAELPPHIRADGMFNPTNTGSGRIGLSMLYGRSAMRFALFAATPPERLFGVGNDMIHTGEWWAGYNLANVLEARDIAPVAVSGGDSFVNAILGAPWADDVFVDARGPTNVPGMNNPVSGMLDIFSPAGRAEIVRRGDEMGRRLAKDAGVWAVKLGNEAPQFNRGAVCPTKWADDDFRAFCRGRYGGDLSAANKAWGRSFASWDDVRQPIYASSAASEEKTGAAAMDWYANMGRIGKELCAHLNRPENLEMAMDWYRWRTKASIDMYTTFAAAARRHDKKTLYTNNYCWPNFFAHLVLPTWRRLGAAALDCQYVCDFPRTLGGNAEMIEILEMAESAMKGRPVIGWEIYVQPHYPGEFAALQNWAMVAHGVGVNMVFAWKPYSDHGNKVFKKGPRAWERKGDSVPMWMLIDTDGTRLPVYHGVKRSSEEIAAFHRRHDGNSLKRTHGRTAVYLSNETTMYTMLKTGDRPYLEKRLCHSRDRIANGLRMGGARIEYLDDETIGELTRADYDAVVLPPTPYMAGESAARLAAFERSGGKVIRLDDWTEDFFEKHPEVERSAYWTASDGPGDVEVVVRTQAKTGRRFVFVLNRGAATKGSLAGSDFPVGTSFVDAISGGPAANGFSLGAFGYRVLHTGPLQ